MAARHAKRQLTYVTTSHYNEFMTTTTTTLLTAQQYYQLPKKQTDHTELVRGVIVPIRGEQMPAGHLHGNIAANILFEIAAFVRKHQLGKLYAAETGFIIRQNPDSVRAPDVAFVANSNLPQKKSTGFFVGTPDLAVEVISPSETFEQVDNKIEEYLAAGTREVWIVIPRTRTITVYKSLKQIEIFSDENTIDNSSVLSGFSLALRHIF
ncbi:MAG TPA: Uma2 family endonuclease, partial [Anaerolineae bacterium]|nr:Uma2 family endonuclease [Anaerolineae bacterium]